jgi:hypothetical protein
LLPPKGDVKVLEKKEFSLPFGTYDTTRYEGSILENSA